MDEITIDGRTCRGWTIPTGHGRLLVIRAEHGLLGCGYLNCEVADKLGDALAVVTGVQSYDDMLRAAVVRVSAAAAARGVVPGMTGAEALRRLG